MSQDNQSFEEILFDLAVQKPTAEERAAFLEDVRRVNPALGAQLAELLEGHFGGTGFLPKHPADPALAATLPAGPLEESPAQMIGRYKLLEKIGEGGFGEVWMAEQREPVKRRVALKIIKLGMDSRQIVARFEAERQALAMMDHANIARIFDAGTTDSGRPYFVMELVRGIKITEYCDQNNLPTKERLALFIEVCQAIQHAHQKGIIHRDIKPSNILVTLHDGVPVPKVIDFGIAKATQQELTDKTVFTQFQQFIGTPAYISPEQAEMSGLDIDTRADIYSLGVLLYELLVGQTPFDAKEMMQGGLDALRQIIREREPLRPSTKINTLQGDARTTVGKRRQTDAGKLVHQLKGDLDWIVMKCLEKDRTRRYDTANGLAMDIQRHLSCEPVLARPPSKLYEFQKTVRRHKFGFAAAAAIIFVLAAGITLTTWQAVRARRAAAAARAAEKLATTSLGTAAQERDRAKRYAGELDHANDQLKSSLTRFQFKWGVNYLDSNEYSKGVAFLAKALRTDPSYWPATTRLISVLTDRGFPLDVLPPIEHDQPIYDHVLNTATGLLVTRGPQYDVRVWSAWKSQLLMNVPALGNRKMPSLSPDGRKVLLVDTNGAALVFAPWTNPNSPQATLRSTERIVEAVVSPLLTNGLRVATRQADGTIQLWNGETGAAMGQPLSAGSPDGGFLSFTHDGNRLVGSFADSKIGIWPVEQPGGAVRFINVRAKSVLRLTPDSQTLVERAADGKSVRFWDLADAKPRGEAITFDEPLARIPPEPGIEILGRTHGHDFEFDAQGRLMVAVSHTTFEPYSDQNLLPIVAVRLFDTRTGRLVQTILQTNVTDHQENLVAGLTAMVINANRLVIRDLATARVTMDRPWASDLIMMVRFSPAGDRILVALNDHRLLVFDAHTGEALTHEGQMVFIGHTAGGSGRLAHQTYAMRHGPRLGRLDFSPEGDIFIATYLDASIQIWDAFEGLPLSEPMPGLAGRYEFSDDGRWVVSKRSSGGSGSAHFDLSGLHVIGRDLSAARYSPLRSAGSRPALHLTPDGRLGILASTGIARFNAETGEEVQRIEDIGTANLKEGIPWLIREAWLSPDGARLVYSVGRGEHNKALLFETRTGKLLQEIPIDHPVFSRFVGNDRLLVVTDKNGATWLSLWDLKANAAVVERQSPTSITVLAVSPDGRRIALSDRATWLLDAATLEPVSPPLPNHNRDTGIYSVAFSPDSQRLATGGLDSFVRVRNARTGELEADFDNGNWPRWVEFSPDSQRVTAGQGMYDVDNPLFVWQVNGAQSRLLSGPMMHPNCLQHEVFSSDNRYVLAGDRRGDVKLWDLDTQLSIIEPLVLEGYHGITRVELNPQMTRLFAAPGDGFLHSRPLPPHGSSVPDWLPQLAEAVAHQRVNEAGGLDPLNRVELENSLKVVRAAASVPGEDGFYARWGNWFVADRATRAVSPLSKLTVPDEVAKLLEEGSLPSLRQALRIAPANPRVLRELAVRSLEQSLASEQATTPEGFSTPAEYYARLLAERAPESLAARWFQAEVLTRMGKLDAARQALEPARRLQPDDANVLAVRAALARREGRADEAHLLLQRALAAPPAKEAGARSVFLSPASLAAEPELFAEASLRNRAALGLVGRLAGLAVQFIDLTPYYNQPAQTNWLALGKPAEEMPATARELEGVPFDIRGGLQLGNAFTDRGLPAHVNAIRIGQPCTRLHFLIQSRESGGAQQFRLRVHYANQGTAEYPVAMLERDRFRPTAWNNPRPEVSVESIDLLALPESGLCLLGVTAQTTPSPVIESQPRSVKATLGQPAELQVAMTGQGPWKYQWQAHGRPIPCATNAVLRIASLSADDLTSYQVAVQSVNDPASTVRSQSASVFDPSLGFIKGELKEELYLDVPGEDVGSLQRTPKFPFHPDRAGAITMLEGKPDTGDLFGRRLSGWLMPRDTAKYVFYLCSDDSSQFSLGTDEMPGTATVIATLSGWRDYREWQAIPSEAISKPIRLEAGRRYFLEVLHKEGQGKDHVSVAWRKAGEPPPKNGDAPISGEFLARPAP